MSIADQNRIRSLEERVRFLEEHLVALETRISKPAEVALDKRTREYREWKNANSSAS